jgi:hypothetical protein
MNDAITSILMGQIKCPEFMEEIWHGRLDLRASKEASVAIQLLGSIKIDAPLA